MKRKQTRIADLHCDVLKHITIFVAKSTDGAASFASLISICKVFKELSTDKDLLRTVEFGNVTLAGINESFWQTNGLLVRCACAGNLIACEILLKRVQGFITSAKAHIIAYRLADSDFEESMNIAKRRACTRAMKRDIQLAMEEGKMHLHAFDSDLEKAEELLGTVKNTLLLEHCK